MTNYFIEDVDVTSNIITDNNNHELDIDNTTSIGLTKNIFCENDITIPDFVGNTIPDLLGPKSKISLSVGGEYDRLNSKITELILSPDAQLLTIKYKNMVGSTDIHANQPLPEQPPYRWPIPGKLNQGEKMPMYKQMQPAWIICYTTISGMNYAYQPPDWGHDDNSSIIDSTKSSTDINVKDLFEKEHPIMIYVVANNSYKVSGMPKYLMDVNGIKQDTGILNSSVFHASSSMPNGNGIVCNNEDPDGPYQNGPDGTEQTFLKVVAATDPLGGIGGLVPGGALIQLRNRKLDPKNRLKVNRLALGIKPIQRNNEPYPNGLTANDIPTVAVCKSTVVNYLLRDTKVNQRNICANVLIGGYVNIASIYKNNEVPDQGTTTDGHFYPPNFINNVEIKPNVMIDFMEMNKIQTGEVALKGVVYPNFTILQTTNTQYKLGYDRATISTRDLEFDKYDDIDPDADHPEKWHNRQPKLTIVSVVDGNASCPKNQTYTQVCVDGDSSPDSSSPDNYGDSVDVTYIPVDNATKVIAMNVNFINIRYKFDDEMDPYYALFYSIDRYDTTTIGQDAGSSQSNNVAYYQMYQNGVKWRIIFNPLDETDKNTWVLQKIKSQDSNNPDGVYWTDDNHYTSPAKTTRPPWRADEPSKPQNVYTDFAWENKAESEPTLNEVTPIEKIVIKDDGNPHKTVHSTTWAKNHNIEVTQVGLMDEFIL